MKLDVSFYVLRIADKFCERDGEYAVALNKIKCSLVHARLEVRFENVCKNYINSFSPSSTKNTQGLTRELGCFA